MALAPVAYLLFQKHLRHNPAAPQWLGRDRFILSCGHSSLTLYIQLFLSGYGVEMTDLQSFRTWGALTPGHPEFGHTAGVETTTGPLGQGLANGVGMAMAARYSHGLLEPETPLSQGLFDHHVYVLCSDGDLQEGVSAEASSLAGTQELANLVVIYDDNRISIEGDTHVAFTEDVSARYRAYGWDVYEVDQLPDGNIDLETLNSAIERAKSSSKAPSLIRLKTVIAWPAPTARGTAKSHGSALGAEEVAATKVALGLNPEESFAMPADVLAHARNVKERGAAIHALWLQDFDRWSASHPDRAELLVRILSHQLPQLNPPTFPAGKDLSTRKASGDVIQYLASVMPEIWGGSADLADSNNTTIEGSPSFLPATSHMKNASPFGRLIHFGIREHAMGAILNGMALHGLTRSFAGTFLVFSDYMRGSVRLSALMNLPVTYVWSHDSIGLGEDGPTHQPVEHAAALRAIPNLAVVRPADANEVAMCWVEILKRRGPAGILLTRQNVPVFDRDQCAPASNSARGAYVLSEGASPAQGIIIATGSEVHLALEAQELLASEGIAVRVVSAPCLEWFEEQDEAYRESVLPRHLRVRVSVEAGVAQNWHRYVGDQGSCISLEHFGASASAPELFEKFGFSAANIATRVKSLL
jgi:transketolase